MSDEPKVPTKRRKERYSERKAMANRGKNYKHGRCAKVVTPAEGRIAQLRKIDPALPEILEAAVAAIAGDLEPYHQLGVKALVEAEVLRRVSMDRIHADGVIVEDETRTPEGNVTTRKKAHPLLENTRHLHEVLGYTAEEMQLTKKSRGQGVKDEAMAKFLAHQAMLRAADKSTMCGPGPIIDTSLVPASESSIEEEAVTAARPPDRK